MFTNNNKILNLTKKLFCFLIFTMFLSYSYALSEIDVYTTIQTVVNTEKVFELPVYYIRGEQEKYLMLKDLTKIFPSTLVYYPVGKYVSFNCRGEKIYFFYNKNYFIYSNKKIYLNSNVINVKNKTFVPISILNNTEFISIINAEIEYRQQESVLLVYWKDSIIVNYYVTFNKAKIEFKYPEGILYNFDVNTTKIILTFFQTKIQPKEFRIEHSIVDRIVLKQQNENVVAEIFLAEELQKVSVKKEENKNKIVLYIEKIIEKKQEQQPVLSQQIQVSTQTMIVLKPESNNNVKDVYKDKNSLSKKNNKLVVIDPGHGGEDPGAVGKYSTKEKDLNLKIALLVKQKLLEEGFNVLLTREEDVFIPLVKRTEFANKNNADLFVSIHCNAAEKPTGTDQGFEIYFLSEKATDSTAVATEKLENEVVRFEKQTEELTKLQKLLWSMIINEFINESSKLCSLIGKEVISRTQQTYRGVKQAGFYVLRGAQMPAVLVECGFISNPNEELRLIQYDFQNMIANGIVAGIKRYYENNE